MKKLSTLIAMILCVTIGGVYATWSYRNTAQEIKHDVPIALGMDFSQDGAEGEYKIVRPETAAIKIEPTSSSDYKAKLTNTSDIYLVFTPYSNASETAQEVGLDTYFYFTNADFLASKTYESTQILSYVDGSGAENAIKIGKVGSGEPLEFIKETNASGQVEFKCNITQTILDAIELMDVELPTYDDYSEFYAALTAGGLVTFDVHITSQNPNA